MSSSFLQNLSCSLVDTQALYLHVARLGRASITCPVVLDGREIRRKKKVHFVMPTPGVEREKTHVGTVVGRKEAKVDRR